MATKDNVRFKDFSDDRKPLRFKANGHQYDCYEALAVETIQEIAGLADDTDESNLLERLDMFFTAVMDEENSTRIKAHMRDRRSPLTGVQATNVMKWIMEAYGARPLESRED